MKTVKNKFKKEIIKELPRALFDGRIEVIQSAEEAERAVAILEKSTIIGLDTETRPNFRGGRQNKVALLQVSTHDICFLFRLKATGMTEGMIGLFTNPDILKVGLSLRDDFRQLRALAEFDPVNYVELQDFVKPFGIQDLSLQKLYANILGGQIHKGQQLSNWEAEELTEAQIGYAATDAWACIMLYEEMQRMRKEGFHVVYEPDEVPGPVFVGLEKPKKVTELESEEEQKPADGKNPRRKKKGKTQPVETQPTTEQPTSVATDEIEVEAIETNNAEPIEEGKNKRRKNKRKPAKDKKEQNVAPEATISEARQLEDSSNKSQRSKRHKGKKASGNSAADSSSAETKTKQATDNPKTNVVAASSNTRSDKKKSNRNDRKRRNQQGEKRRDASRRPIPEMAAPLDEAPAKKKGGFMKKMLMGIVEKLT